MQRPSVRELVSVIKLWKLYKRAFGENLVTDNDTVIFHSGAYMSLVKFVTVKVIYLTFKGPYIVSIFQYISNKMQRYTAYLYLDTAQHISRGISTRNM